MAALAPESIPNRIILLTARAPEAAVDQELLAKKLGRGCQWAIDAGWDVEVWGVRPWRPVNPRGSFRARGPRLPVVRQPFTMLAVNATQFWLALRHRRAGIIIGTGGWGTIGVAAALRVTGRQSPFVINVNVHSAGDGLRRRGHRLSARVLLEMERFVFRSADLILTVGSSTTNLARQLGVPEDRILQRSKIASGQTPGDTPRISLRSPNGARDPMLILCAARLEPRKAIDILVRAFATVRAHFPDARLEIAGQGSLRPVLESLTRNLDLQDHVTFRGGVRRHDMPAFYERGSVFVLPSRADEGLPKVVVEALLAGCTVVGTNVRGTNELIESGVTGELVPPDDPDALAAAITALLADPMRAVRLAERGQQVAVAHQVGSADGRAEIERRVRALQAGSRRRVR